MREDRKDELCGRPMGSLVGAQFGEFARDKSRTVAAAAALLAWRPPTAEPARAARWSASQPPESRLAPKWFKLKKINRALMVWAEVGRAGRKQLPGPREGRADSGQIARAS